ncbi:MAG: peroxiredoxin [Patescibacteria group bacterium]|jgi:peroxiredoxin Q/BCP
MELKIGDKAPALAAADQTGKQRNLEEFHGSWLLLYFYPKDFTSGCTTEACTLRDNFSELKKKAKVMGVSADSVGSHQKFSEKYHLPFDLLADPQYEIIKSYGANGLIFPKRVSFLIDPEGVIKKVYKSVKPAEHAEQVLKDLNELIK